jgi:hypothetical protein
MRYDARSPSVQESRGPPRTAVSAKRPGVRSAVHQRIRREQRLASLARTSRGIGAHVLSARRASLPSAPPGTGKRCRRCMHERRGVPRYLLRITLYQLPETRSRLLAVPVAARGASATSARGRGAAPADVVRLRRGSLHDVYAVVPSKTVNTTRVDSLLLIRFRSRPPCTRAPPFGHQCGMRRTGCKTAGRGRPPRIATPRRRANCAMLSPVRASSPSDRRAAASSHHCLSSVRRSPIAASPYARTRLREAPERRHSPMGYRASSPERRHRRAAAGCLGGGPRCSKALE